MIMMNRARFNWTALLGMAAALVGLAGCAAPPVPYERSAAELVAWLNVSHLKSLSITGDPQPQLKAHPTILRKRCEIEGGKLQERATSLDFKDTQTGAYSGSQTLTNLTVCEANGAALWGATTTVERPETLWGNLCSSGCYYGAFKLTYLDGPQAAQALARRDEETRRAMAEANACADRQKAKRDELRSAPRIGDQTSLGLVIDVRAPMVLIQFNPRERNARHRDQEWVPAGQLDLSSLSCK